MKRIHNYILLSVLAFAAVSCIEEKFENDMPLAESGDEVQFGVSLGNPETRTVYGGESNNAFPIYWVNGDKVKIFSPDCLGGNRNAEYQVAVDGETQNYASSLTKTGSIGIQWGEGYSKEVNGEMVHNLHNFYSLYPTGDYELSTDGTKAEKIFINYSQNIVVDGASVKSDMEDCLMYARKEAVPRGETVNLHYDPISTVFMVTLNVPSTSAEDFTIQSISIEAEEPNGTAVNIAGTFSLNISNGSFGGWGDNKSNIVSAQIYDKSTGGYYTLTKGNDVEVPLFIAPVTGLNTNGWKIKVVANAKEYVKTLGSLDLAAGKIHKVTLPNLSTAAATEWDVSKWMTYVPRNVYLSEVSIPGTWNSLNKDFQTKLSISEQYALGVRAFHIDTRWKRTGFSYVFGNTYEYSLGTADGGNTVEEGLGILGSGRFMTDASNPTFEESLSTLATYLSNNTSEYMVVICSFAQGSANYQSDNGFWYDEISAICNKYDQVYDARQLSSKTLVGDVLGKLIVIVNLPSEISSSTTLPKNSKCLFTYLPSNLTSSHFSETDVKNVNKLWQQVTITDNAGSEVSGAKDSGINIYNNQAQITSSTGSGIETTERGYAPSLSERTTLLNNILNWSKGNYSQEDYKHNQWIYLGLGGYQVASASASAVDGSYVAIETEYNSWINDKVEAMGQNGEPYYPVGIVLMNNKNGEANYTDKTNAKGQPYNFAAVVKNILLLNNRYRLQYDSTKPSDYDPNALSLAEYGSTAKNGGDAL